MIARLPAPHSVCLPGCPPLPRLFYLSTPLCVIIRRRWAVARLRVPHRVRQHQEKMRFHRLSVRSTCPARQRLTRVAFSSVTSSAPLSNRAPVLVLLRGKKLQHIIQKGSRLHRKISAPSSRQYLRSLDSYHETGGVPPPWPCFLNLRDMGCLACVSIGSYILSATFLVEVESCL